MYRDLLAKVVCEELSDGEKEGQQQNAGAVPQHRFSNVRSWNLEMVKFYI